MDWRVARAGGRLTWCLSFLGQLLFYLVWSPLKRPPPTAATRPLFPDALQPPLPEEQSRCPSINSAVLQFTLVLQPAGKRSLVPAALPLVLEGVRVVASLSLSSCCLVCGVLLLPCCFAGHLWCRPAGSRELCTEVSAGPARYLDRQHRCSSSIRCIRVEVDHHVLVVRWSPGLSALNF